ncbi:ATP-dependent dethiobiotin synthetase BioD [Kordiimonas sediminis]|uniref:ATP-dependent dethiobiotin synthetase BioD n=1 Tax=Kordiimonas sediminis TaxID=1735581 RepID=A0A919ASS5_9PROT|nr:dethiobiotin synthase [Kordiimonas sediminis]GHF22880.1 ATP-dependent dethiobiotin synthetase BioD [Kordiimonas sediminis]
MQGMFISSTGTEIGKTLVTASLVAQLRQQGQQVTAIKPVISGVTDQTMAGSDTAILADALGLPQIAESWDKISPFRYRAPLAPTMAAAAEGKTLDYDAFLAFCRSALAADGFTLVEGVGGSFVPLVGDKLVADWIADMGLASILVAGSYLGTISHTLATLEAMQARGLSVAGLVVSESLGGEDSPDFEETVLALAGLTGLKTVALPRLTKQPLWASAPDLTSLLV